MQARILHQNRFRRGDDRHAPIMDDEGCPKELSPEQRNEIVRKAVRVWQEEEAS